jgi:hypothetical protein
MIESFKMSKVKNLAYVTYTHSNCADIWNAYFARLDKYTNYSIDSYVFSNLNTEIYENHTFLLYDDNRSYSDEFIRILNAIPQEYFIYMQEDFILYDNVDLDRIKKYIDILENDRSISYIRMIKCGTVTEQKYVENLYYVSSDGKQNKSVNSFSMQPTIWRKSDFIKLYKMTGALRFGESLDYAKSMNTLNINGLYHYAGEPKRGGNHYDTYVFPYIATAIVKGKWNVSEYPDELKTLFREFNIQSLKRGYC